MRLSAKELFLKFVRIFSSVSPKSKKPPANPRSPPRVEIEEEVHRAQAFLVIFGFVLCATRPPTLALALRSPLAAQTATPKRHVKRQHAKMAGASWSSIALLLVGLLCSASFRVGLASEDAAEKPMTERDAYEILGVDKRTLDKDIRRIFKEKSLVSQKTRTRREQSPGIRALLSRRTKASSRTNLTRRSSSFAKSFFTRTRRRGARKPSRSLGKPTRP